MARSLWKGPLVDTYLLKKLKTKTQNLLINQKSLGIKMDSSNQQKQSWSSSNSLKLAQPKSKTSSNEACPYGIGPNPIRVWSRRSFILPEFVNQSFEIYNGKQFILFKVNEDMVGHKFGEFASTRKKTVHKKKNQK